MKILFILGIYIGTSSTMTNPIKHLVKIYHTQVSSETIKATTWSFYIKANEMQTGLIENLALQRACKLSTVRVVQY